MLYCTVNKTIFQTILRHFNNNETGKLKIKHPEYEQHVLKEIHGKLNVNHLYEFNINIQTKLLKYILQSPKQINHVSNTKLPVLNFKYGNFSNTSLKLVFDSFKDMIQFWQGSNCVELKKYFQSICCYWYQEDYNLSGLF